MRVAYCPWCYTEIQVESYEAHTEHPIWRCPNARCPGKGKDIISDIEGFVLEPPEQRNRYIYSKRYQRI